jgi:drug/metabolite transporter (DMT)-like permease
MVHGQWIYLKLIAAMIIWGGTFVAGKIVVQSMGVWSGAFLRFAIASLCLGLITYFQHRKLRFPSPWPRDASHLNAGLTRQQWFWITIMGLTGVFLYSFFFLLGLQLVPASRAALIVTTNPIAVAIGAALFFRESLTRVKMIGILLSVAGAAIVISKGDFSILARGLSLGDLSLIACVFSWAAYTLSGRKILGEISSLTVNTYACLIGTMALLIPALLEGLLQQFSSYTLASWLAVAYGGAIGSAVSFIWFSDGIRQLGAAKAAIFINLVPISAIALSALILKESLTSSLLLGGFLTITGVICTNRG